MSSSGAAWRTLGDVPGEPPTGGRPLHQGGRALHPGGQPFRGDHGAADARVAAALAAYAAGQGSERDALKALAATRFLVPVVAILAETGEHGAEKDSEMALPTLIGNDGRAAIIVFTSVDAVKRWRPDARPIPAEAGRVWQAAVAEAQAVVIDVAGPVPFVVEGARLQALATGQPPPAPHEDPDIQAEIAAAVAAEPAITGARVLPSDASDTSDLQIQILVDTTSAWEMQARRAATAINARLTPRFPRGIEISVVGISRRA